MFTRKRNVLAALFLIPLAVALFWIQSDAAAKEKVKKTKTAYVFKTITEVPRTPVKNQYRTGTCWCFSTISYLESELLRMGKGEFDLSEMYVVRRTYPLKAENYVRMSGKANHSAGGQAHDVLDQVKTYGLVPEAVYPGMHIDESRHNHGEMSAILQGIVDAVVAMKGQRVTPRWLEAYEAVLDTYLGKLPVSFEYNGKNYTPVEFYKSLGLNPDDYVEFTSYSHHPFNTECRLDVPDNWTYNSNYYNVPIDDLEKIADYVLKNGHSFVWDGDVSEKEFSSRDKGYAIVPGKEWDEKTIAEQEKIATEPEKEREITQEMRQKTFNNHTTTDDHLMHVVGLAQDQEGNKYYFTKNSGGTVDRPYNGYIYLSRGYFRLKTTALLINKHSLPPDIKSKLGIE